MTNLGEAVRRAYFDALSGFYQVKPMHEHQWDAFDHIARGIERACDAAQKWPDPKDVEGMQAAALAAFTSETFTDFLAKSLPDLEYQAVLTRADAAYSYRIAVRDAQSRGEQPPPVLSLGSDIG